MFLIFLLLILLYFFDTFTYEHTEFGHLHHPLPSHPMSFQQAPSYFGSQSLIMTACMRVSQESSRTRELVTGYPTGENDTSSSAVFNCPQALSVGWGLLSGFPMQEEMVTAPSCAGHWCSEVLSVAGRPPHLVFSILLLLSYDAPRAWEVMQMPPLGMSRGSLLASP